MISTTLIEKNEQLFKKSILLVELNSSIRSQLYQFLKPFYNIVFSRSVEQVFEKLKNCPSIDLILTNLCLDSKDHALMDGFSIVRYSQFLDLPRPVIVYTDDLHPLAEVEASSNGTFKVLDLSQPTFKKNILTSIYYILKIDDWKSHLGTPLKASKRVRELLNKISFLMPIQWNHADEDLYNCFFLSDTYNPYCYANSWAYVCQTARNNGHKFFDGNCLITVSIEQKEDIDDFQFVIINPIGRGAVEKTLELVDKLKSISGNPVIIKKLSKEQEDSLLKLPQCKLYQPSSDRLKDQYDDIFPQVVVNLKAFMNHLTSTKLTNFQRNLKKFCQRNYMMKTTEPELFEDFLDVVLKWKRTFIRRYEERGEFSEIPQDNKYYISPYFPIFEYYCRNIDNKNTLSSIVYVDNIPVGFSFLSRVSHICMGMYANLADTDYEGLSEFMLYQNFTKAYWSGYKYVNLGGTESKYLYDFYSKFNLSYKDEKSFEIKTNYLIYE